MRFEFTPALELALDRARRLAAQDGSPDVNVRHLLRALVAEEEGRAVTLLVRAGADWPSLQAAWVDAAVLAAEPNSSDELRPHESMRQALASAADIARHHGDDGSVTTDHVLLALLTAQPTIRAELAGLGLDFESLRHSIVGETAAIALDVPLVLEPPIEQVHTARIIDASANRAREAMRVLEDYTRFVLDDALLSEQLKQLRHDFATAIERLPAGVLLDARDTENDVGTTISTAEEGRRSSVDAVVVANAKRLQEAMRSLEEYGKILLPEFGQLVEQLRYRCYTLERALAQGQAVRARLADAQLYVLVTSSLCRASLVGTVKEAVLGGAQIIQLREKDVDDRTLLASAREVRQITRAHGVFFIVNDRPDIARLAEADGVHLGQDDLPLREARRLLGPDALIGVSTHNLEQVYEAVQAGASYLGVGPTFPSQTKTFAGFAGIEFVRQALAATSLPAFAIGGIDADNLEQVQAAGARRIAVSHAICAADDPRAAALRLRTALARGV